MAVQHVYSNAVADGTATSVVRPSDWNSYHNQYLTISGNTAGQSTVSGTNIVFQGGTGITLSANTATNGATIVIAGTNQTNAGFSASGGSSTFQTLNFANSNGVSFSNNGGSVVASVATNYQSQGAYLTTAMASNAGSDFVNTSISSGFQQTSATSAITSNAFPSANTTKFAGLNTGATNASLTVNTSGISVSVAAPVAQTQQPMYFSASGTNTSANTLQFGNSNGVSFSLSNGSIVGSVATNYQSQGNYLTTGMQSGASSAFAGTGFSSTTTAGTAIVATNNTAGLSLGVPQYLTTAMASNASSNFQSTGAYLTTAMVSNAGSNFVGLNTALTANGLSATINSSGISLNMPAFDLAANTSNYQQTSATSAITSNAFPSANTTKFAGIGFTGTNASATFNSNGLQLSVAAPGGGGGNTSYYNQIADSASTVTSGTVVFGNGNGVSFGLNGSTMTASVATNYQSQGAYLTTAMVSDAGSNFLDASGAFNGTNITGTIGSNGLSLSVAAPGGGAGVTMRDFFPMQMAASSTTSFAQNTLHFAHIIPNDNISMTCIEMLWSVSMSSSAIASWNKGSTIRYGIYSEDPSGTIMNSVATSSMAFIHSASSNLSYGLTLSAGTNSATLSTATSALTAWNQAGYKIVSLPMATSLSAGLYYFAYAMSTSSSGANVAMTNLYMMNNEASNASMGALAPSGLTATNKSIVQEPYGFILSVTTGAMPATVAYSDVSINSNTQPYLYFEA